MMESSANKKLYNLFTFSIIILMTVGLLYDNSIGLKVGFILHSVFVILLSICLLLYPRLKSFKMQVVVIILGASYFYSIFFLYPETVTSFTLLCVVPIISILFFESRLFNFSILFNLLAMFFTLSYVQLFDQSHQFDHLKKDFIGNIVNFLISQLLIYVIYYLAFQLLKKQQVYYEQLQNSERLKTTGQLAAAVAHEIRNPLTTVKGFLQFYSNSSTPINSKEHFSLMVEELDSAEQVISHFLTFAKPDQNELIEIVDVNTVLFNVKDLLYSYGDSHHITIELNTEKDCLILGNYIELKQLMLNIVKNAIEASYNGNSVMVTAVKKNQLVQLQVIDEGVGMTEEEVKSLGTPFYSLKSNGTGLGLMICYQIVERYNGHIHFQSVKGKGTTVTISFPSSVA